MCSSGLLCQVSTRESICFVAFSDELGCSPIYKVSFQNHLATKAACIILGGFTDLSLMNVFFFPSTHCLSCLFIERGAVSLFAQRSGVSGPPVFLPEGRWCLQSHRAGLKPGRRELSQVLIPLLWLLRRSRQRPDRQLLADWVGIVEKAKFLFGHFHPFISPLQMATPFNGPLERTPGYRPPFSTNWTACWKSLRVFNIQMSWLRIRPMTSGPRPALKLPRCLQCAARGEISSPGPVVLQG